MVYVNSFRLIQKGSLSMQWIMFNARDTVASNRRSYHVNVALFRTQHNTKFKTIKRKGMESKTT